MLDISENVRAYVRPCSLKAMADHIFQVLNIPGFTNDTESSEEAQSSMLELCEKELGSDSCTSMRALRQVRVCVFEATHALASMAK